MDAIAPKGVNVTEKKKERLGIAASILTTASFVPQVYQMWSQIPQPAEDVSWTMFLILSAGIALWLVYGILRRDRPLIFANTATLISCVFVLVYKAIYG